MKKIFALVLAVAMLSSTAFAAGGHIGTDNLGDSTALAVVGGSALVTPGSNITIGPDQFALGVSTLSTAVVPLGEFNNANFAIYKRTFKKGANLVKSVTINDDDERVVIELNQNLELKTPNAPNLVIDQLSVKAKKAVEGKISAINNVARNAVYNYSISGGVLDSFRVGYTPIDQDLSANPEYQDGQLAKFNKSGDVNYAVASLGEGDLYIEGRVYDGDKIYVDINSDVEKEVLKAYPDADLRFINLVTSGFTSNNVVNVLANEDEFVYEVVDKKIVKTKLTWDTDAYAWAGKTIGNKSYVISDIELKVGEAPVEGETTDNPETGANDVVGIAAALAVVSLVAAGAVSLKK